MSLEVGSRIAHYDVTALIGEGGMLCEAPLPRNHRTNGRSTSIRWSCDTTEDVAVTQVSHRLVSRRYYPPPVVPVGSRGAAPPG